MALHQILFRIHRRNFLRSKSVNRRIVRQWQRNPFFWRSWPVVLSRRTLTTRNYVIYSSVYEDSDHNDGCR